MEANFSLTHSAYIEKNKRLAVIGAFSGMACADWRKFASYSKLISQFPKSRWLDYGCGPATQYKILENGLDGGMLKIAKETSSSFYLYDPCHEPFTVFPVEPTFDGVLCIDVLEHIPESDIDNTLEYLFSVCTKWMYLFISNKKNAHNFLDSHESTHCTIKTKDEWIDLIYPFCLKKKIQLIIQTDDSGLFDGNGFTSDYFNVPAHIVSLIKRKFEVDVFNGKPVFIDHKIHF